MSSLVPYADLMKTAGAWLVDPVNHGSVTLDANGWPTFSAFPTNTNTKALVVTTQIQQPSWVPGYTDGSPTVGAGTYSLQYTPNAVCPCRLNRTL